MAIVNLPQINVSGLNSREAGLAMQNHVFDIILKYNAKLEEENEVLKKRLKD